MIYVHMGVDIADYCMSPEGLLRQKSRPSWISVEVIQVFVLGKLCLGDWLDLYDGLEIRTEITGSRPGAGQT